MAQGGGLVIEEAQVNALAHLGESLGEGQIRRGRVHRVPAEDEQHVDRTGLHGRHQLPQGGELILGAGHHGRRMEHGLPHVAENLVHGMGQRLYLRAQVRARHDDALSAMAPEVLDQGIEPARIEARG
ncbi:hypothetical protein D3C86_1480230 [compost metagenome]